MLTFNFCFGNNFPTLVCKKAPVCVSKSKNVVTVFAGDIRGNNFTRVDGIFSAQENGRQWPSLGESSANLCGQVDDYHAQDKRCKDNRNLACQRFYHGAMHIIRPLHVE